MIFKETALNGLYEIELERLEDERGFFARTFSREEFKALGLNPNFVECSISFNPKRGTLRGMHYQAAPHEEAKLVRCTMGAVYDVVIDLRHQSPTSGQWMSMELTAENRRMLYVPEGCAHGFQTLETNSEVLYQMSEVHRPEAARGIKWNDPAFGIVWPTPMPAVISRRDMEGDFVR